jgi:hypothetical protein
MAKRLALSLSGLLVSALGGGLIGYARGYQAAWSDIASVISNAVSVIPLFGSAIASELTNYVNQQSYNAVSGYYMFGVVLFVLGVPLAVLGGREGKKVQPLQPNYAFTEKSPQVQVQQSPVAFCTKCGSQLKAGGRFCPSCGNPT